MWSSPQQVKPDPSGPARLQVSAGFSWDLGLSSLRPATADPRAQDGDSSAGEESEETDKVGPPAGTMTMRGGGHRVPHGAIRDTQRTIPIISPCSDPAIINMV